MSTRRPPVQAHQHGSKTGYTYNCRCQPCCAANTRSAAERRRAKAYGLVNPRGRTPIGPSQQAVRTLHAAGYTDSQISRLTGLPGAHINRIRRTGSWVTLDTAERIARGVELARTVPPRDLLAERYVDATGARRRVQALMTQGWGVEQLGLHLGRSGGYLSPVLYDQRRITPALHRTIVGLYDELWRTPGPSSSTRKRALHRGWASPLELDDDRIDDPTYTPTLHRLTPQIAKRQRREQILATVAQLTDRGLPVAEIALHAGITPRSVDRYRKALREAS